MKKAVRYLSLMALLLTIVTNGQERKTEIMGYVPLRTYHYERNPEYQPYHPTEGGNVGLVGIYRVREGNKFNDLQAGVVRNSYDNISILLQYGFGQTFGKYDLSINVGAISGYKNLFEEYRYEKEVAFISNGKNYYYTRKFELPPSKLEGVIPGFMSNNGIIPSLVLSMSYDTGTRFSPLVNFSPDFINVGFLFKV